MSGADTIEAYLTELADMLPPPASYRERVLAEVAGHLAESVARHRERGTDEMQATRKALAAFGPAEVVGRRFAGEAAVGSATRAAAAGGALLVVFLLICNEVTSSFAHIVAPWLQDGPGSLVVWLVAQVAVVAGVVSAARVLACRSEQAAGLSLLYVARANTVVSACAAVVSGLGAVSVVSNISRVGASITALTSMALVIVIALAALTVIAAARAARRYRHLALLGPVPEAAPIICDARVGLASVTATAFRAVAGRPSVRSAESGARRMTGGLSVRMPWLGEWIDERRHPWRFLVACLGPLALLTFTYVVVETVAGGSGSAVAAHGYVFVGGILVALESGLAVTGFAVLGPYLGLRPRRRAADLRARSAPRVAASAPREDGNDVTARLARGRGQGHQIRVHRGLRRAQRAMVAVASVNVVLIVAGAGLVPATVRSPDGVAILLADIGMQLALAVLALRGPVSFGRLELVTGTCLGIGTVFAFAYDGLLLADFAGHPLPVSPYPLFIAAAGISSVVAGYRTRRLIRGTLAAIWTLVFGTAVWSAGFLVMAYAFWDTRRAYLFFLRDGAISDFRRSGTSNLATFLLQDIQGALFFHPILSAVLGLACGTVGASLGCLMAAAHRRVKPRTLEP